MRTVTLYGISDIPKVVPGDDLAKLIAVCSAEDGFLFEDSDVVVIAQKVVSKAEGDLINLRDVTPSEFAHQLAERTGRDPRLCEVYIRESELVLGTNGRMVITRHRLGFENTNACVDRSNVGAIEDEQVALLPIDPDASAQKIREGLRQRTGRDLAVIISDSLGKPDREGAIGMAIGLAGIRHLEEHTGHDLFGNSAGESMMLVDALAGAAGVIMGEMDQGIPVVVIRGVSYTRDDHASIRRLLIPFQKPSFFTNETDTP
jgi:coenzyme F420-0:L-glutamate ligase/coenzyme F420-1:gamma-L-glutamate ligase